MSSVFFAVTITERKRLTDFIRVYKDEHIAVNHVTLGHGTAQNDLLDALGLDSSERALCFSTLTDETWINVKKTLERKMRIDIPGTGIVFLLPFSSIAGKRELSFLIGDQTFTKGEEQTLKNTEHELIIAICEQGHNEVVMNAARKAGAGGGTVIHAKGTGMHQAEKFLGISLAAEKDVIFIVTLTSRKNAIMQAITQEAGLSTRAKAICFSLPVTDTAGLRLIDEITD